MSTEPGHVPSLVHKMTRTTDTFLSLFMSSEIPVQEKFIPALCSQLCMAFWTLCHSHSADLSYYH